MLGLKRCFQVDETLHRQRWKRLAVGVLKGFWTRARTFNTITEALGS